jgi:hypothetical protein
MRSVFLLPQKHPAPCLSPNSLRRSRTLTLLFSHRLVPSLFPPTTVFPPSRQVDPQRASLVPPTFLRLLSSPALRLLLNAPRSCHRQISNLPTAPFTLDPPLPPLIRFPSSPPSANMSSSAALAAVALLLSSSLANAFFILQHAPLVVTRLDPIVNPGAISQVSNQQQLPSRLWLDELIASSPY